MDLRKYELDLIGQRFIKRPGKDDRTQDKNREFTVEEVFPYYVRAFTVCENGYKFYEGFSIGDLIQMGMIKTKTNHEWGRQYYNGYGL